MSIKKLKEIFSVQTAYQVSLQHGTPVYLVGGAVRDALMGVLVDNDCDFVVGNYFYEFVNSFAKIVSGKIIPWDFLQTRVAFRKDGKRVFVDFAHIKAADIVNDLMLRDYTVNACAVDLKSLLLDSDPEIIDPLNGSSDLQEKCIRICSIDAFDEDPLRILRGVRFAQKFDFVIEKHTYALMKKKAILLEQVSRERVKKELFAIFAMPKVAHSLRHLVGAGITQHLVPEFENFSTVSQSYPHQYNLFEHSLKTVEQLDNMISSFDVPFDRYKNQMLDHLAEDIEEGVTRHSLLMFTGLLHDSGKPLTQTVHESKMSFKGHDTAGALLNKNIAGRLGLGRHAQRIVEQITENHMRLFHLSQLARITKRAKIRLINDIDEVFWEVLLLAIADARATTMDHAFTIKIQSMLSIAFDLIDMKNSPEFEAQKKEILSGRDIMNILGIPEGFEVGQILHSIYELEKNGLLNSKNDAITWLKEKKQQL